MAVREVQSGKVRITVRFDPVTYEKLRFIAAESNESVNMLIARWVAERVNGG